MMPLIIHDLQDSQMFALAQAAGRAGIPVAGTSWPMEPWVAKSRYIKEKVELRCLSEVLAGMYAYQLKESGLAGVWLPCVDDVICFTVKYQQLLRKMGMRFIVPDMQALEMAMNVHQLPDTGGLKVAPMQIVPIGELYERAEEFHFPLMIKSQRDAYMKMPDAAALRHLLEGMLPEHAEAPHRIQSYIEGDIASMASAILLFDDEGRPVRGFTARREQVASTRFGPYGETTAARSEWIPELYEGAKELLKAINWRGFAEVECKQGADGQWYVLEINPRLSGWSSLAEADGAGLLSAYHHLCSGNEQLAEAVEQRSETHYLRMIGTCYHAPCWDPSPENREGMSRKILRLIRMLKAGRAGAERLHLGAWDWRDWRASLSIARRSFHRVRVLQKHTSVKKHPKHGVHQRNADDETACAEECAGSGS